jgi:hypothetical protein
MISNGHRYDNLIIGAFIAGFSPNLEGQRKLLEKERAADAREGKARIAKARNDKLDAAIRDEAKALNRAPNSIEFARLIRPGVMKRLGLKLEAACANCRFTNGGEDCRSTIPRCYENYTYRLLENFVPRCGQWVPLSQISSSNAQGNLDGYYSMARRKKVWS